MAHQDVMRWIESQATLMRQTIGDWARINTFTHNTEGLAAFAQVVSGQLAPLGDVEQITLPQVRRIDERGEERELALGRALRVRRGQGRPIFLGIHMDTVYPVPGEVSVSGGVMRGPGVADAKGGLLILLTAAQAVVNERPDIPLEILFNPDEEIGSPGSARLLEEAASRCSAGLVFEPALPDGSLVATRKGSANFTIVVRGRSAHAGRDFSAGRSAVHAIGSLIVKLAQINGTLGDTTVNVGKVYAGGPVNVVADLATCGVNVRSSSPAAQADACARVRAAVGELNAQDGIRAQLHEDSACGPKVVNDATRRLMDVVEEAGGDVGVEVRWGSSGGVSDGNRLAAAGLSVVDTLGAVGGKIHSPDEFLVLPSLVQRAKLAAQVMLRLCEG